MFTQPTLDVLAFIAKAQDGIGRRDIKYQFPDLASTVLNRLWTTEYIKRDTPESGKKIDELFFITERGAVRLKEAQDHPARVSSSRNTANKKPPVKVPSHMDDAMRRHLENEGRIGADNDQINGILKTIHGMIISGLESIPEVKITSHPMEKHNQKLREKLVSLKEQLEQ